MLHLCGDAAARSAAFAVLVRSVMHHAELFAIARDGTAIAAQFGDLLSA